MPTNTNPFTEDQKRECCLMVSIGCDRETACNYLGKTAAELRQELRNDPEFKKKLLNAEATPELFHMRNLYQAAKEEKNWRISVWWLERRAPERFARRAPDAISTEQLQIVIEELTDAIVDGVGQQEDRQRLLERLQQIARSMKANVFDDPIEESRSDGNSCAADGIDNDSNSEELL